MSFSHISFWLQGDLPPSEHEQRPVLHQQQRAHHHHRVCKCPPPSLRTLPHLFNSSPTLFFCGGVEIKRNGKQLPDGLREKESRLHAAVTTKMTIKLKKSRFSSHPLNSVNNILVIVLFFFAGQLAHEENSFQTRTRFRRFAECDGPLC